MLMVRHDRSGLPQISSRIGITRPAVEITPDTDLRELVRQAWVRGKRIDYLIVDEAQFLSAEQVDQLAELADDLGVEVYCFGIAIDFRSRLFPGAQRLFEVADALQTVQVEVLCWCGVPGRFNARVQDGQVLRAGDTVLVADAAHDTPVTERSGTDETGTTTVRYQVLCRRHFRAGDLGPTVAPEGQLRLA